MPWFLTHLKIGRGIKMADRSVKNILFITIIIFTVLAVISGLLLYFNIFNSRNFAQDFILRKTENIPVIGSVIKETFNKDSDEMVSNKEVLEQEGKEKMEMEWETINEKKAELDKREKDILQKEEELKEKEESISQMKKELEIRLENIEQMASLYNEIKPSKVVEIFNNLDDELIIQIMHKMRKNNVAEVLAGMDPKRAAELTKKMTVQSN